MIEHEINDYAGYGHIQPERVSPASNGPVPVEALAQSASQCDDHQRDDGSREHSVRDQDAEINGSRPAFTLKSY